MGKLENQVAIVTGGGTGIGAGISRLFASEGAKLVIASRNRERLEATADEIKAKGGSSLVLPTDVTKEAQVISLFKRTMAEFGKLDILVNNSGAFDGGLIDELSMEAWQRVMDVNLTGPFLCTREAMKIMKRQRYGRIINIGSISAQMPRERMAAYTTTKHGLVGLTKTTALEGRAFGISAGCLHPGNVLVERRAAGKRSHDYEPMISVEDLAMTALTMAALPPNANMLEVILLPVEQPYIGRG